MASLPMCEQRAEGLAHASFNGVLNRNVDEPTGTREVDTRLPWSCTETSGEGSGESNVSFLVTLRTSSSLDKPRWRSDPNQLVGKDAERVHRCSLKMGYLGEVVSERAWAVGGAVSDESLRPASGAVGVAGHGLAVGVEITERATTERCAVESAVGPTVDRCSGLRAERNGMWLVNALGLGRGRACSACSRGERKGGGHGGREEVKMRRSLH